MFQSSCTILRQLVRATIFEIKTFSKNALATSYSGCMGQNRDYHRKIYTEKKTAL